MQTLIICVKLFENLHDSQNDIEILHSYILTILQGTLLYLQILVLIII